MIKTDEYRKYIKQNANFRYSDDVAAKIKAHNPAFTKATTAGTWEKAFGRTIKQGEKPFGVEIAKNQIRQFYDISQTVGKPPVSIYQNISGKVKHYQQIIDGLIKFSPAPVVFQKGASYYSGVSQDGFTQDGEIILRPALSEQQAVFALIREIVSQRQASDIVVEAVSYMVCRHLNIDTSVFTFGYLLEIMGFDESLKAIRDRQTQDAINNEAEVLIGFLNANLPLLHGGSSESYSNGGVNDATSKAEENGNSSSGEPLELSAKAPKAETTSAPIAPDTAQAPGNEVATGLSHSVKVHTERVNDIEFKFLEIVREFRSTLPDKTINLQQVKEYGYYDTKMHPIGPAVAARLLSTGREIYKLHTDNSEARISSTDDIKKHRGFFGISIDEWATAQVQMLKDGVKGVTSGIDRWNRTISPDAVEEAKKRKIAREKAEAHRAAAAQKQAQAQAQAVSATTAINHYVDEESLAFSADGGFVIAEDDLAYNDIENHKWLETALLVFFEQTGFKPVNMPYFINKQGFAITAEMKKINSLMGGYCADLITRALEHKSIKTKNPKNGKFSYNVQKAVALICQSYSPGHIAHALNEYWPNIKAPKSIKRAFDECFDKTKKKLAATPRRETPDESMRRVKTAEEAKTGGNPENAQAQNGVSAGHASNERNAEIYHIIDSYSRYKPPKPKKPASDIPILPPTPATAR